MPYSRSLKNVLHELKEWGIRHRQRIVASRKAGAIKSKAPERQGHLLNEL
jgi:DNA-binding HxlR family transcriptional regulator